MNFTMNDNQSPFYNSFIWFIKILIGSCWGDSTLRLFKWLHLHVHYCFIDKAGSSFQFEIQMKSLLVGYSNLSYFRVLWASVYITAIKTSSGQVPVGISFCSKILQYLQLPKKRLRQGIKFQTCEERGFHNRPMPVNE